MESKHTLGPWRCYPEFGERHSQACYTVWDNEDNLITTDPGERFEIARVIENAPNMLTALKEIISEADQSNGGKGAQLPIVLHIRSIAEAAILRGTEDGQ